MVWQVGRDLQPSDQGDDVDASCCSSGECLAASYSSRPEIVRVAISAAAALPIQAYLTAYEAALAKKNLTSNIQLNVLPSLQELQKGIRHDLSTGRGLYASYIVPPLMLGDLLELRGLATISLNEEKGDIIKNVLQDLLPYYRTIISTFGGAIRGIPLLAGNQPLLVYRRDYLEAMNMSVPSTWGDYVRVASVLHDQPLATNGTGIYGSCMGRINEAHCRKKMDQEEGVTCDSMSMSYIGMTIAPMTQRSGSSTGWLFDDDTEGGMQSLLKPTLETALAFMEQQLKFGAPNELEADSSLNLDLFRQGQCGMTITIDHPVDLLMEPNVGFAPVPGSYSFLDRSSNTMVDCSPTTCPFGVQNEAGRTVNRVSYGAMDLLIGAISTYASDAATAAIKDFFSFIVDQDLSLASLRQQPLTYSSLNASTIDGYKDVMLNLTESKNMAIPLRIPDAFSMYSVLDNHVYDYLATGNYSQVGRQMVRERVEASLQRLILQNDARRPSFPIAKFYESSLDRYVPTSLPDLYIAKASRITGWSLACLSCCCSLFFAWWVWKNNHHPVIRASQTSFLNMICFGTFLMAGSIFLFGVEDNIASMEAASRSCMGSMWLYSMGFVFTEVALSTKVWLINRVFRKARNLQRIKIEGVDLLGPFLFIGGINLIILMTWNISDPVVWVRAPVEDPPNELNYESDPTYGYCNSENYRVFLGIMLGVNYVVSVVSLVQAYECRMISTDYLESLWIGAALFAIVQVWTVGLPLLKLLDDDPNGVFLVKVGVIFLTTMCTLLLIFLPKMDYLRESISGPEKPSYQGHDSLIKDQHSITSHESDDSHGNKGKGRSTYKLGASLMSMAKGTRYHEVPSGLEGIRIIQSSNRHSEELEKLQRGLRHAEARHKTLNDRLERLQEKLEQYIVSHHPNHLMHGSSKNFILSARSERVKISS